MGGPVLAGGARTVSTATALRDIHDTLLAELGPSGWWPGDSPFEVAVGAILTQNTNWKNVEKAIDALKAADLLLPQAIANISLPRLEELVRPAGYFRQKAKRLKNLVVFLTEEGDGDPGSLDLEALHPSSTSRLRERLLAVNGVGPETCDSILLYALNRPVFVVDTYTHRLAVRHGLMDEDTDYHQLQDLFASNLDEDPALFNEFHALIVRTGNKWCKKTSPLCDQCPLERLLP